MYICKYIYTHTNLSIFIYIAKYGSNAYKNVNDDDDDDWDEMDDERTNLKRKNDAKNGRFEGFDPKPKPGEDKKVYNSKYTCISLHVFMFINAFTYTYMYVHIHMYMYIKWLF
jgi:hypothetical protein